MTTAIGAKASPMLDAGNEKARGAGTITFNLPMAGVVDYQLYIEQAGQLNTFGSIKSMWYNNMNNPSDILMSIEGTDMRLVLPKNSQGMLPIVANTSSRFSVQSAGGAGTNLTQIQFYNFVNAGFGIPNWAAAAFTINTTSTGKDADGTPPTGYPVLVAGYDGTNVQTLLTDNTGQLVVATTEQTVAANLSNVAVTTVVTGLQVANANRKGYCVYNDSLSATLYLKLGATATVTSFTVKIPPNGYWEMPKKYTGIITGIWDIADASGAARNTEFV